ncbi:MAG: nickel-dependent hydrogenase large subunit, partial [Acidimicrobiales bacterium]
LEWTRVGRIMCMLMYGKYPHPSTIVPGGMSTTITTTSFNEYYAQLGKIIDWCKVICRIWDDVMDFFFEANPDYELVGARPMNLAQTGIWDDSEAYDATYANCNEWGDRRWAMPGIIINGTLRTTKLTDINMGFEEFIEHSFYDDWTKTGPQRYRTDPLGNPISPYHPWNKTTIPRPTATSFKDKYTWDTAPRWDRQVVETGTYGRMWTTALSGSTPDNPFFEATGDGLRMILPRYALPETELFWPVPRTINALERNRARSYACAFTAVIGMNCLLKAFEYWRRGETKVHTPFRIPRDERVAVGFWEAGRGWLVHHEIIDKGKIVNYQITTPSTLNAAPTDPFGGLGPYEQAIVDTPLLESVPDDQVKGIDVLRAIRSFDPCMPCTTHMDTGRGTIVREVNSCGCTLE